ncbi:hypothetical protein Henu3_gp104 [Mycobacterium phage Henu3]|uniref:Uncharacterized protein n=1 Tax=Mycobacterium phage Henu3 TaxID=2492961 RepID=A0A410T860_9CAUD|nr:hypothetical protein I5G68_gp86 [Mycobacterium phage Henu3]QAU05029.1 hypothetical protein Henu3_gp104 [Mycobacterium phage Henu3]
MKITPFGPSFVELPPVEPSHADSPSARTSAPATAASFRAALTTPARSGRPARRSPAAPGTQRRGRPPTAAPPTPRRRAGYRAQPC